MDETFALRVSALAAELLDRNERLATAESCTGGWVAKVCTDLAGSSAWFDRGYVTYSNDSKQQLLGVSGETLERHGAVSEQTVREMVAGVLERSNAHWALAISGVAGPGGAAPGKPVGTVWFGWGGAGGWLAARCYRFDGDRDAVRRQSVAAALDGLLERLREPAV